MLHHIEQGQLPCVSTEKTLLASVKRQKLAWFGHVTCHDSLSKTVFQGTLEGARNITPHRAQLYGFMV